MLHYLVNIIIIHLRKNVCPDHLCVGFSMCCDTQVNIIGPLWPSRLALLFEVLEKLLHFPQHWIKFTCIFGMMI